MLRWLGLSWGREDGMQQQEIVPHLICMAGSIVKNTGELSPKNVVRSQRVLLERSHH